MAIFRSLAVVVCPAVESRKGKKEEKRGWLVPGATLDEGRKSVTAAFREGPGAAAAAAAEALPPPLLLLLFSRMHRREKHNPPRHHHRLFPVFVLRQNVRVTPLIFILFLPPQECIQKIHNKDFRVQCFRMTKREKYSYIPPTYKWGKFKIFRLPSRSFDLSIKNLSHHFLFLPQSGRQRQGRKDLYFKFRRGEKLGKD